MGIKEWMNDGEAPNQEKVHLVSADDKSEEATHQEKLCTFLAHLLESATKGELGGIIVVGVMTEDDADGTPDGFTTMCGRLGLKQLNALAAGAREASNQALRAMVKSMIEADPMAALQALSKTAAALGKRGDIEELLGLIGMTKKNREPEDDK